MKFDLTKFTSFKKCSVIPDSVGVLAIYFALFLNVGLLDYTFAQGNVPKSDILKCHFLVLFIFEKLFIMSIIFVVSYNY